MINIGYMAQIHILGNLGSKPEPIKSYSGTEGARLSVAVNKSIRSKDDPKIWHKETMWFGVSVYGVEASRILKDCDKGDKVAVVGEFDTKLGNNGTTYLNIYAYKVTAINGGSDRKATDGNIDIANKHHDNNANTLGAQDENETVTFIDDIDDELFV